MFGSVTRGFAEIIVVLVILGVVLGLLAGGTELLSPSKSAAQTAKMNAETQAQAGRDALNLEKERQKLAQSAADAALWRRLLEEQLIPAVCLGIIFIAFGVAVAIVVKCLGPLLTRR